MGCLLWRNASLFAWYHDLTAESFDSFKMTEIASMMDSDKSHSGSSGSDDDADGSKGIWEHNSTSSGSMRGLQIATAEGWLIQRARDMCNFSHDRYRQAVLAEAQTLPKETIAKMSLKVRFFLLFRNSC
jgi:hypothetical protein